MKEGEYQKSLQHQSKKYRQDVKSQVTHYITEIIDFQNSTGNEKRYGYWRHPKSVSLHMYKFYVYKI